jgi:hypothetical protein
LGGNDFIEGTSGGKDYYFGEAATTLSKFSTRIPLTMAEKAVGALAVA